MALKPNKIEYGGNVLLDLTQDNVEADALVEGYTAHNAAGEPVLGANPYEKTTTDSEVNAQAEQIAELREILSNKAAASAVVEELTVTENGTYNPPSGVNGFAPVTVNVQPKLQEKSVTPSTQAQEVTPDSGYDGMSKVNISAVKTAEQATPSITVEANGLITAKANQSEGYVSSGEKSATKQLPTMAGKTVAPSTAEQTVVSAGTFVTGNIKVAKIPDSYIQPSGTKSITENGTHDVKAYASVEVNVPTSGGSGGGSGGSAPGGSIADPVRFYDYDGTILYSYTADEFLSLSEMPELPTQQGLICQGWNWSFDNAQEYVSKYGMLNVGATYITDDGKTRIYIKLEKGRLSPYLGFDTDGTVVVDWGDGSATQTVTGTSTSTAKNTLHNYAAAGEYVITLEVVSGSIDLVGISSVGSQVLWKNSTTNRENRAYNNAIQKIEIGNSVRISNYAFNYCHGLASVTIPDNVTSIGDNAFNYCYSLASVTIPDNVTSIGDNVFYYCYGLASVTIPDNVTSIGDNVFYYCYSLASVTISDNVTSIGESAFNYCYSLASVTIPDSVTSIGNNAFYGCYGMGEIHFKRPTPPTVNNSNAWRYVPSDCIIYVPRGSLSAYTSATNYPSASAYTYVEE